MIPAGIFLGQISSSYREKFKRLSGVNLLLYYSLKRGVLGSVKARRTAKYDVLSASQSMDFVPPYYKADTNSLDFIS